MYARFFPNPPCRLTLLTLFLTLSFATLSFTGAQAVITVDRVVFSPGENLELHGENLPLGTGVRVRFTSPDAPEQVLTQDSSERGSFHLSLALPQAGSYGLEVETAALHVRYGIYAAMDSPPADSLLGVLEASPAPEAAGEVQVAGNAVLLFAPPTVGAVAAEVATSTLPAEAALEPAEPITPVPIAAIGTETPEVESPEAATVPLARIAPAPTQRPFSLVPIVPNAAAPGIGIVPAAPEPVTPAAPAAGIGVEASEAVLPEPPLPVAPAEASTATQPPPLGVGVEPLDPAALPETPPAPPPPSIGVEPSTPAPLSQEVLPLTATESLPPGVTPPVAAPVVPVTPNEPVAPVEPVTPDEPVTPVEPVATVPAEAPAGAGRGVGAFFSAIGAARWLSVLGGILAILGLHLTLFYKYRLAQKADVQRRIDATGQTNPFVRLFTMRYYSLAEKLVFVLLFAITLAFIALAQHQAQPGGTWLSAVGGAFTNPWTNLRTVRPPGLSAIAWTILQVLFLVWAGFHLLFLLFPRPRSTRTAPRTFLYPLLAFFIPGTGLADDVWGLLLLFPWGVLAMNGLATTLGWGAPLNTLWLLVALGVIYAVNTVAVIIEYLAYRRRREAALRAANEYA